LAEVELEGGGRDEEQIVSLVNAAVDHYKPRNDMMLRMLDMYEVAERPAQPGGVAVRDNMPHTAVGLAAAIITRQEPQTTIMSRDDTPEEQQRASRIEQVFAGIRSDMDQRAFRRGDMSPDYENAFNQLNYGWIASRQYVAPQEDGKSPFRFTRHYNPMNIYPGPQTDDGYLWVFSQLPVAGGRILADKRYSKVHDEIDPDDPYKTHELVEFYDDTDVVTLIDNTEVWRDQHKQGEVPWLVGPVNGHNFRGLVNDDRDFVEHMGMALNHANRDLHDYYNELLETMGLIVKKYAKPTVVVKTRDGTVRRLELGSGAVNTLLATDIVQVLDVPGAPPEMVPLLQSVLQAMYRATFQESVYGGGDGTGMSALAITLTGHHAGLRLEPYLQRMQMFDVESARRILKGIEREQLTMDYAGTDGMGNPFRLSDFSYLEIDGDYGVYCTRKLSLPEDDLMRAQVAASLTQGANPVVSMQYAREKILLVQDPMKERNRVIAELPLRMPEVVMAMAYQELINNNENLAAQALGQALGIAQSPGGPPGGGPPGGGAAPGGAGPMGMGGPPGAPPGIGMMGSPGMQAPGQGLANYDTSQFGGV
jgi:hypothetical protein